MIRGMKLLETSMSSLMARQEVLAQNVANHQTPGYKQEYSPIDDFSMALKRVDGLMAPPGQAPSMGSLSTEVWIDRVNVDFRQGDLHETDRPLDVALLGDGFLRVRTPDGDFFSRGGPLQRDAEGHLVTAEGYQLLGADGPMVLGEGKLAIHEDGTLSVDEQPAGRLSLVEFQPGTQLVKAGEGLYAPEDPQAAPAEAVSTAIKQGNLEDSNVDLGGAMSEMVWVLRAYQVSQRMLQAQDELLGKAVNEVGRVTV